MPHSHCERNTKSIRPAAAVSVFCARIAASLPQDPRGSVCGLKMPLLQLERARHRETQGKGRTLQPRCTTERQFEEFQQRSRARSPKTSLIPLTLVVLLSTSKNEILFKCLPICASVATDGWCLTEKVRDLDRKSSPALLGKEDYRCSVIIGAGLNGTGLSGMTEPTTRCLTDFTEGDFNKEPPAGSLFF